MICLYSCRRIHIVLSIVQICTFLISSLDHPHTWLHDSRMPMLLLPIVYPWWCCSSSIIPILSLIASLLMKLDIADFRDMLDIMYSRVWFRPCSSSSCKIQTVSHWCGYIYIAQQYTLHYLFQGIVLCDVWLADISLQDTNVKGCTNVHTCSLFGYFPLSSIW